MDAFFLFGGKGIKGGREPWARSENTTGMMSRKAEQEVQTERANEGTRSNHSAKKT